MIFVRCALSCSICTDGRTEKNTEAICRFTQFFELVWTLRIKGKLFSNDANSPNARRFCNPTVPKLEECHVYIIFMCGRKGEFPRWTETRYKLRWEDAVQYNVRIVAFQSNASVIVCKQTNKQSNKHVEILIVHMFHPFIGHEDP